jgi:hypothetical protein
MLRISSYILDVDTLAILSKERRSGQFHTVASFRTTQFILLLSLN